MDLIDELKTSDAKSLAAFVWPDQTLSLSGRLARKFLVNILSAPDENPEKEEGEEQAHGEVTRPPARQLDDDELSTSLEDFREFEIDDMVKRLTKKVGSDKRRKVAKSKTRAVPESDGSTDTSSEDERDEYHKQDVAL